jgi:exopolysaccharide biosynthesis polyprenyl glycosylphosphotransferase
LVRNLRDQRDVDPSAEESGGQDGMESAGGTVILPETAAPPPVGILFPGSLRSIRARGATRAEYRLLYAAMAITDVLSVAGPLLSAQLLPSGLRLAPDTVGLSLSASPVLTVVVFSLFGLYRVHLFTSAEEFRRVLLALTVIMATLIVLPFTTQSRGAVAISWVGSVISTSLTRRYWHAFVRRLRRRGRLTLLTIIAGLNDEALRLSQVVGSGPLGFRPIGFLATAPPSSENNGLPVLGRVGDLARILSETRADCVFVASTAVSVEEMRQISKTVRRAGAELRVTANLPEVLSSRLAIQAVGGVMALSLKPVRLTGPQATAKRAFDLAVSGAGLILSLPIFSAIALAIRLLSPGPIFYRQERVGRQGAPFKLLKFRTMVVGADAMLPALEGQNEALGPLFKIRKDPRVTRIGRWLRRWSLDELPQLINVVRGDMSLVGPRPPLPHEVTNYDDWHFDRLEVRPGITGLWQVNGRSELSFDEGARLDIFYIENWSLSYDLFILAKTIPAVLSSRGAY